MSVPHGGDFLSKRGRPKRAVEWDKLETRYITSNASYIDVAREFDVGKTAVCMYGGQHEWPRKRAEYRERVKDRAISGCEDLAVSYEVDRMRAICTVSTKMVDLIAGVADEPDNFFKAGGKVDTRSLREYVLALVDLTKLVRDLYDIPTAAEREAREIAGERVQLERQKVASQTSAEGREIRVVLGDAEGMAE